ncbi:MAG TPA: glucose-6-phosphate dehydrogenase [Thermoanaerobaculia bacterium]|nr:glucose-6-phosphate dehydrogenase [Thermoanaerobaculia bacterium]
MVIFGAQGDLTKRKLIPALYNLASSKLLADDFAVLGIGREGLTDDAFRERLRADLAEFATSPIDPAVADWLFERLYFVAGDFTDAGLYERLAKRLGEVDAARGTHGDYLFYLAIPPSFFDDVVLNLASSGLLAQSDGRWRRLVIEKPFGRDVESARALNRTLTQHVGEDQIYRIDHYLGKETVQNIMAFRFANGIFEPIWNRRYIDHVQITVAESVGVESRGAYYEEAGALRDMLANHMFTILALVGMEPPISFASNAVRDERMKVLQAIHPLTDESVLRDAVRGQYREGVSGGERVPAYRAEARVSPTSNTETFVALKLTLDNWRFADVPFYLRTGKRLPRRVTEVAIQFKRAPFILFRETPVENLNPNLLVLHIQPDEGISLRFEGKVPGPSLKLGTVRMAFQYADYFGARPATGYETLLYDAMTGDSTLFLRSDMVEAGWQAVQPILDVWGALAPRSFPNYDAGSWGPKEANDLIERDGRKWRS